MMSSWGLIGREKGVTLEISEYWSKTIKAEKQFGKKKRTSAYSLKDPKTRGPRNPFSID